MTNSHYSDITADILQYAEKCVDNFAIDPALYGELQVKRGLRDLDGRGVLTGLTEISEINAYKKVDGKLIPCEGELYYRGIPIRDLVHGFSDENRFGFEETVYLLLFGTLPNETELDAFKEQISAYRNLPTNFVRDVVLKAPTPDLMNTIARSVLTLSGYDNNPTDISIPNVLRQCLQLIATLPLVALYAYHAYIHYIEGGNLYICHPDPGKSTAENILYLLRPDGQYTELEAKLLDVALVLHA
ncbi:MAG: citrate synthase, partial [Clostridia bacterium]|nr:citrate synthase [Clostridia bacterium]